MGSEEGLISSCKPLTSVIEIEEKQGLSSYLTQGIRTYVIVPGDYLVITEAHGYEAKSCKITYTRIR